MPTWWRYNPATHIFEHSLNEGTSWAPPPLNASIINEGIIGAAHLPPSTPVPPNIAFTNVNNQFTLAQRISNADGDWPRLTLSHVGGAADKKHFQIINISDLLQFWPLNDAQDSVTGSVSFSRIGDIVASGTIDLGRGQVKFPATANPSSNPNTLDEYEEGAWTPIWGGISGNLVGTTYYTQVGRYMKIGSIVIAWFYLHVNVVGSGASGDLIILGFPFYNINDMFGCGYISFYTGMAGAVTWVATCINPGLYYSLFYYTNTAMAGMNKLTVPNIAANMQYHGVYIYRAQA